MLITKNISPAVAVINMMPYEKWSGNKTNLEYLWGFGYCAFVHIPKKKRNLPNEMLKQNKLFTEYCQDRNGYCLIDPASYEVINTQDVYFLENQMYH